MKSCAQFVQGGVINLAVVQEKEEKRLMTVILYNIATSVSIYITEKPLNYKLQTCNTHTIATQRRSCVARNQ